MAVPTAELGLAAKAWGATMAARWGAVLHSPRNAAPGVAVSVEVTTGAHMQASPTHARRSELTEAPPLLLLAGMQQALLAGMQQALLAEPGVAVSEEATTAAHAEAPPTHARRSELAEVPPLLLLAGMRMQQALLTEKAPALLAAACAALLGVAATRVLLATDAPLPALAGPPASQMSLSRAAAVREA